MTPPTCSAPASASTLSGSPRPFSAGPSATSPFLVENWGLDYLTTAFFVALLAGFWRGRGDAVPWLVAGGLAVAAKWWLPGTWYIILGAVAGSLVGAWRDSR